MDVVDFVIKTSTMTHPETIGQQVDCEVINNFMRMWCMYLETLLNV